MVIDLLLIFLFDAENDLRRHYPLVGVPKVQIRIQPKRRRIFEQVGDDLFVVDQVLHVSTGLVDAEQGQAVKNAWVDFLTTVCDDTYNHLCE